MSIATTHNQCSHSEPWTYTMHLLKSQVGHNYFKLWCEGELDHRGRAINEVELPMTYQWRNKTAMKFLGIVACFELTRICRNNTGGSAPKTDYRQESSSSQEDIHANPSRYFRPKYFQRSVTRFLDGFSNISVTKIR